MINKPTAAAAAAVALVGVSFALPAFAQAPAADNYNSVNPNAFSYAQPVPYGWTPYGYAGWAPRSAADIDYNIHTPPNH